MSSDHNTSNFFCSAHYLSKLLGLLILKVVFLSPKLNRATRENPSQSTFSYILYLDLRFILKYLPVKLEGKTVYNRLLADWLTGHEYMEPRV